jgi:nitrogen fixation protein FixH
MAQEADMGELTGKHVLAITVGAFGVIIAVNLAMAWQAISTFPGLEVANSYVASQTFDDDKAAQQALGWTLTHGYDPAARQLTLTFTDARGYPAELAGLSVMLGRTTQARDDQRPEFVELGGSYRTEVALKPGKWMMHVEAVAPDGTLFRQRLDLFVKG